SPREHLSVLPFSHLSPPGLCPHDRGHTRASSDIMVNWIGLAFPFIYLGILVGSLATFSSLYRRRKACRFSPPGRILSAADGQSTAKAASLEPWFGPHLQRDVYLSLLHIEPQPGQRKVPDSILKAALLRRACEGIHRIVQIRNSKQALANLLQR